MKKVILNKCYGGFGISRKAYELYAKKKGLKISDDEKDKRPPIDYRYREDKTLIEVVEELGEEANGRYADLKIVEIPDDLNYTIDDYDGIETLHQKVQEW